ncbi:SLIT-ROBO Rho GTPase-activating protein 1 [Liparis tanakae]|uniref:SLIT-ROBO Rho GTPase-activating protein 1 n=1 Tax=Liparis tanakae TaxID=230148 RepID=A0A4Z2E9V2_9TELE|nr:SLIT-ROBO Rho GTPase-activating protein 1 [Liparis tanakae]
MCCDLGYHSSLSRALRTYLSAELSLEASRRAGLEVLEGAVEGLDPARDRQRLLGLYPTAFCPPLRFSFQAHMGDAVTQIASQPQLQAELTLRLTQLQTRLASLKIENEEVGHSDTRTLGRTPSGASTRTARLTERSCSAPRPIVHSESVLASAARILPDYTFKCSSDKYKLCTKLWPSEQELEKWRR